MFIDQGDVMVRMEETGIAYGVDKTASSNAIYNAIVEVRDNPKYKENVIRLSKLLRDRRSTPMDDALWLIEYVGRTKGANHLKLASRHLNIFQYYSVDSGVCIFLGVLVFFYIFYKLFVRLMSCCDSAKQKTD